MKETYLTATEEQLAQFVDANVDGPILALNLLKFVPNGGKERYAEYIQAVAPFLEKHGAKIRVGGEGFATLIGAEEWDEVVLVEYPSRESALSMIGEPDYPNEIREGALVDSRLYCFKESG